MHPGCMSSSARRWNRLSDYAEQEVNTSSQSSTSKALRTALEDCNFPFQAENEQLSHILHNRNQTVLIPINNNKDLYLLPVTEKNGREEEKGKDFCFGNAC